MRHIHIAWWVAGWLAVTPTDGRCQRSPDPDYQRRGLELNLSVVRTSAWTIEDADIPASSGIALEMAYGIQPWIAPYLGLDVSLFGQELSGFTTVRLGMIARLPVHDAPVVLSLRGEFGRLDESGNRSFWFGSVGGGVGVFWARRWEFELNLVASDPLVSGRRAGSSSPLETARADFFRVYAGLRWHIGGGRS